MLPPSLKHWSIRYALDRARLLRYSLANPDAPWLTPEAVAYLERWLRPDHVGFEWGAGRSTIWLGRRVRRLVSIETDRNWHKRTQDKLNRHNLRNVDLRLVSAERSDYVKPIEVVENESLDFVLVDGVSTLRDVCVLAAIPKLKQGGLLVVDDVHRYLPSDTRSPLAIPAGSRPLTLDWERASEQTRGWRCWLTSSGVTDTLVLERN